MKRDVYTYLKSDFINAIQSDLIRVLKFHHRNGGGFHSIPRETFCYIDYLATLRYDSPNSSKKAIWFIENYMGKINSQYTHFGNLIYEMWRHGTVHEYDPKVLIHSSGRYRIGWSTNNSSHKGNRKHHLECFKVYQRKNKYVININLFQLADDLIAALQFLLNELKSDKKLEKCLNDNFKIFSKPIFVRNIDRKSKKSKRKLNFQITNAIKHQAHRIKFPGGEVID